MVIVARMLAGVVAGNIAYAVLLRTNSPWEGVLAAVLIGVTPGLVPLRRGLVAVASLASGGGWILGAALVGLAVDLGAGAWIFAGGFLGFAVGVRTSVGRAVLGLTLGLAAGIVVEISRYLTVLIDGFRYLDMQLLVLLTAGLVLPLVASLVQRAPARRVA